jgi:hypothetical protein
MFGTIGRAHIKPENRQKFAALMTNPEYSNVPGYRRGYLMFPESRENEVVIEAAFEDRDSYFKNADDPVQDERYLEYRALLEDDPEWTDGEWIESLPGTA